MGGRSGNGNRNNENRSSEPQRDIQALTVQAVAAVKSIDSRKKFNMIEVTRPSDGHQLTVTVEKVTTRNYWGQSTGEQTYTVYIWDETQKNEYGNSERLYYNYGMKKMSDVKDRIKGKLGI